MRYILFILGFLFYTLPVNAAPLMQYTATVLTTQGGQTSGGKMYVDNNKIRVEAKVQSQEVYSIVRPDLGKLFSVIPSQKVYTEIPISENDIKMITPYSADVALTAVGDEKINGQDCTKYKMDQIEGTVYLWLNKKTQAPVQMTAEETGMKTEWQNLKVGAPAAKLFEPPLGYQKLDIPEEAATQLNQNKASKKSKKNNND